MIIYIFLCIARFENLINSLAKSH